MFSIEVAGYIRYYQRGRKVYFLILFPVLSHTFTTIFFKEQVTLATSKKSKIS